MKVRFAAIASTVAALAVTVSVFATAAMTHPAVELVAGRIRWGG